MIFFLGWIIVMLLLIVGGAMLGAHNQSARPGYRVDRLAVGSVTGGLVGFLVGLVLTFVGFLVAGMII